MGGGTSLRKKIVIEWTSHRIFFKLTKMIKIKVKSVKLFIKLFLTFHNQH